MWFIGVEVQQEMSAPPPKKNPGFAPVARFIFRMEQGKASKNGQQQMFPSNIDYRDEVILGDLKNTLNKLIKKNQQQ